MVLAISALVLFIVLFIILSKLIKLGIKIISIIIIGAIILSTAGICVINPKMHKPFSVNIIEYFLKINDDGSMTTTKQVTKTVIQDKHQEDQK